MDYKNFLFALILLICTSCVYSQFSETYQRKIIEADSLYDLKEFKQSSKAYSEAIKSNRGEAFYIHRYNAACTFALIGEKDSAFYHLNYLATINHYNKLNHIKNDEDLLTLHQDARWAKLVEQVSFNYAEKNKYKEPKLIEMLDSVYHMDQDILSEQSRIAEEFGWVSEEVEALNLKIDSLFKITRNLVTNLLDNRGWLGSEVIGNKGNSALFLVIQHADLETQQKYLPMMRQAVKDGKAKGSSLALLEDRVQLKTGKKQVYGSQIGRLEDQTNYVRALEDPMNVDKRRAEVGLEPLNDYTQFWKFNFDAKAYLKKLPEYETILKKEYEASLEGIE
jgi:hypothetical protein